MNDKDFPGLALGRISKEILALAIHHKEMLERRFPSLTCNLREVPYCPVGGYWLRLQISEEAVEFPPLFQNRCILAVSFSSDFIKIERTHRWLPWPKPHWPRVFELMEEINYADPRFTENILSDILVELVR